MEEMRYTFYMLIYYSGGGGVIWLTEGHVIHDADILAKKTYCKWHESYTHTTNECNYFQRQVQSAINDSRLTLGDGGKMKLNMDPFPVGMVELMDKKVLVRTDQAEMTKGKNVVVSNELHNRMIKPHNSEIGVWKENVLRKLAKRVKPTPTLLIEKYQQKLEENWRYGITQGIKRDKFFEAKNRSDQQELRCPEESQKRLVHHSTAREPRIRQNP
jgi:hypothetical protein